MFLLFFVGQRLLKSAPAWQMHSRRLRDLLLDVVFIGSSSPRGLQREDQDPKILNSGGPTSNGLQSTSDGLQPTWNSGGRSGKPQEIVCADIGHDSHSGLFLSPSLQRAHRAD